MDHALRITLELRKRPTREECDKQIDVLKKSNQGILIELTKCREERTRQSRKSVLCSETKRRVDERMFEGNETCYQQLVRAKEDYNKQIQSKIFSSREREFAFFILGVCLSLFSENHDERTSFFFFHSGAISKNFTFSHHLLSIHFYCMTFILRGFSFYHDITQKTRITEIHYSSKTE